MTCAACQAPDCGHSDPVYAGIFPAREAPRQHDTGASGADDQPFHGRGE